MSSQSIEQSPTTDAQRRGHMAALSVAEQIVSISPVAPTHVRATCRDYAADKPSVDVYFHRSAGGVEELAEVLGADVTTRPNGDEDPRPFTSMVTVMAGVSVQAWTLGDESTVAVVAVAR
ncbi:hypothetical protein IPZ58_07845 [Streptomyces roseoverticillatus]|uniref:hypothetical protein n=1 Tax=Streptomyces roseoverticillatus TaxID=66429 RepID=UPI001F3BA793|nr:hypothetical protein [Streptomyces roseoverticillatus]MCF3101491.1 hypothetical protein [Streptomyces roseoverticillatus]